MFSISQVKHYRQTLSEESIVCMNTTLNVVFVLDRTSEPEPVLLNVYGAPELMPRNEFRQPM
jgi:hypothetical protein